MQNYLGYICILLAAAFWGLLGPVGRLAFEQGISPLEAGFWRAAFGGIFFIMHACKTRSLRLHSLQDGVCFFLFGIIGIAGFFVSYQYAVKAGGAALSAVLLYTAPAWVAVFSYLIFKESITRAKKIAILVSLAGVACISFSGGTGAGGTSFVGTGVTLGLLSGLLYATHYIFSKKYLGKYTTSALYGFCMAFGVLALLPIITFAPKNTMAWVALFTLGFVCTYLAYLAYCEGIKRLAPTKAAVLATLEPVTATFFAWLFWDERFFGLGWLGAALVLGAVVLMLLDKHETTKC